MSYGRIRRGPMAADAFTQIRNAVFRDPRLSAKAMGIFGNISTHRDGWGITPELLSTQMRDGVSAIKAGLRELEEFGYLQRQRERRPDGTLGASEYFITDQPEAAGTDSSGETPRSEPKVDSPPEARPTQEKPPVDDHQHKKTNSKKTRLENTNPPPSPPPPPATPSLVDPGREGGGIAPLDEPTQRAADALLRITATDPRLTIGTREAATLAPLVTPWLERTTEAALHGALTAGLPPQVGSPVGLLRARLLTKLPPARASTGTSRPGLPAWCGRCGDGHPAARSNPKFRTTDGEPGGPPCPDCHPARVAVAA